MALRWTQPLTEMSTRNLPGGKGRPAHKATNRPPVRGVGLSSVRPRIIKESSFLSSFVRELSVQLWSVNQRLTEAEEVTDS
jgi:hypothetical protein